MDQIKDGGPSLRVSLEPGKEDLAMTKPANVQPVMTIRLTLGNYFSQYSVSMIDELAASKRGE